MKFSDEKSNKLAEDVIKKNMKKKSKDQKI